MVDKRIIDWVYKSSMFYPTEKFALELSSRTDENLEEYFEVVEILPKRLSDVVVAEKARRRLRVRK